jgi:hypothetical protein
MVLRFTWTTVVGVMLLVVITVAAPFGDSLVPKIIWEPFVGVVVFTGLFLLFVRR